MPAKLLQNCACFKTREGLQGKSAKICSIKSNNAWRGRYEDYGVTFLNADSAYEEKQTVVKYKTSHSSLAALFGKQTVAIATYTDASTGTDLPPVPAAPAVGAENVPPAHELQIVSADKDKIVTRSGNNKLQEWHHIVATTKVNDEFERFRHALSASHAMEILERLATSITA
jgi:hypothetical protein